LAVDFEDSQVQRLGLSKQLGLKVLGSCSVYFGAADQTLEEDLTAVRQLELLLL
jgi:hypothetical protein